MEKLAGCGKQGREGEKAPRPHMSSQLGLAGVLWSENCASEFPSTGGKVTGHPSFLTSLFLAKSCPRKNLTFEALPVVCKQPLTQSPRTKP